MLKMKKIAMIILTGVLMCAAPASAYASDNTEEIIMDNQIDSLLSDPDKAVDVIMYVKDMIDQQDISDEEILSLIDQAADNFNISLSDDEKNSLLNIVKKIKDMEIDEDELRNTVTKIYDKIDELGIEKEDVKGFIEKAVDFVKSLF